MRPNTYRTRFALALCLGSFFIHSARASQIQKPIKFLTLNFNSEDAPNDPDNLIRDLRFNALNHWIEQNNPDIIVMQEDWDYRGDPSVALTVARKMDYDVVYRVGMGFPGMFLDSNAILAKKSLGMREQRDLELPHSASYLGDGKSWVIPLGAVSWALGVKLTLGDGTPLYLYDTHLIAETSDDRADGLRAIDSDLRTRVAADGIQWSDANIIIAGDFNSDPTESGPLFLSRLDYEDAFATTHPGDDSCSDCGDPRFPWFNPITIGYGLTPSQTTDEYSGRVDYVFTHSTRFKALASTLVFTGPYQGVWMSDHYGVFTILGDESLAKPANPVHDVEGSPQDSQIVTITNEQFLCQNPWMANDCDESSPLNLPRLVIDGPRGITIENRSDFYFEIAFSGPGDIFTSRNAALNPNEETSFSFNTSGHFTYSIQNIAQSPNPYRARLHGEFEVRSSGY
jgi:endonuclease/exonuclease/phosphatase family metal-dependent hydrolase